MRSPTLIALTMLAGAVATQEPARQSALPPTPQQLDVAPAQQANSINPLRRSGRPPDAQLGGLPDRVLFDRPEVGGPLWLMGHDWKGSVDATGFTFIPFFGSDAPRNFPLRLELAAASVGGENLQLVGGDPRENGTTVRTDRGPLHEVLDLGLRQVEQSFVFDTLPNRGVVAIDLTIVTELEAQRIDDGIAFANQHGSVAYRHAIATDAAGASTPLTMQWNGASVHIEIPATFVQRATLPLVLDPWLTANPDIASTQVNVQAMADIATMRSPDLSCVVWRNRFSATDEDVFATILDADTGDTLGGPLHIDFTSASWNHPAVAGNYWSAKFLVVSQVDQGGVSSIRGRMLNTAGTMDPQFDIERSGIGGSLTGNNYRPDVGGDPYPGTAAYYTVVYEHETAVGNTDIHFRQINQDGTLRTVSAYTLAATTTNESHPSIGKSDGEIAWTVTWQRTWPSSPYDEDVHAARISWTGAIAQPAMLVAGSVSNETAPAASSPVFLPAGEFGMVAYEFDAGGQRDVHLRVFDATLVLQNTMNLSTAEGPSSSYDQKDPDVDSDGTRFAVTYAEPWSGIADDETLVTTVAYEPVANLLRIDENRVGLGLSVYDEVRPRICSFYSGGRTHSPVYFITDVNVGDNDVEVYKYAGHTTGAFFTTFASECGTLGITPSGSTDIGGTVTITVDNGVFSGTLFGTPGYIPINVLGCSCVVGVADPLFYPNPLVWTIPANPIFVGYTLSVQGWTVLGSQCLGNVFDFSDTIDFHIK